MLFETEKFRIGSEALESIVLDLQPTQRIWQGQNYTSKLFGIFPQNAKDLIERSITWLKFSDVNLSYRTRKMDPKNFNNTLGGGSNIAVQLNFDYIEKEFMTTYIGVLDIMSKVGGL